MKKILTTITLIFTTIILAGSVLAKAGTINTSNLNFRSKPSTDSNVIKKLNKGDKVDIISEEGDWYKISYDSKEGYVKQEYVDEDTSSVSENTNVVEEPEVTSTDDVADSVNTTNMKEETTLYILPLLNATKVGVLQAGQKVLLISVNGNWAYIKIANMSGWVFASKLAKTDITITGNSNSTKNTNTVATNSMVSNTVENKVNETIDNTNTSVNQTTNTKVEETETQENEDEYPTTMYVNVDDINVRAKANTSSTVITTLEKKQSVKVIGKENNWYKVETSDGTGYVREDLLKK